MSLIFLVWEKIMSPQNLTSQYTTTWRLTDPDKKVKVKFQLDFTADIFIALIWLPRLSKRSEKGGRQLPSSLGDEPETTGFRNQHATIQPKTSLIQFKNAMHNSNGNTWIDVKVHSARCWKPPSASRIQSETMTHIVHVKCRQLTNRENRPLHAIAIVRRSPRSCGLFK